MPYFITDSSPDCSGWATVKEDGEVIGCHTTKQDAIDQMVAISIAEELEPGGERATADELAVGDFVSWGSSGGRARGQIVRIVRDGNINVPDSDFVIAGTPDDPAALIRLYREIDNEWQATSTLVGHKFSTLRKIDALRNNVRLESGPQAVIVDIDGTLIDGGGRVEKVYNFLDDMEDTAIFIVTGRNVDDRESTIKQLDDLSIDYNRLFMNPGSTADTADFKRVTAENLLKEYNVILAIDNNPTMRKVYRDLGITALDVPDVPDVPSDENNPDEENVRVVNLEAPAYMRAAARRGLELNRQGFGGDGLTDKTKQEARDMAEGRVSEDKWRRIAPWIARHLVDLDAPKNNNPDDAGYPGAGLVAHLLWGSGPSKRAAQRTLDYAQSIIDRLDAEQNQSRWSSINVNLKNKEKENQVNKVERRVKTDVDFELRVEATESDGMRFTGYAAVFNSDSEPLPFIERIMPGAFKRSLKARNEVKLFKNHNMDEVLASTRSKTLRLSEDSKGLLAEATLPDTTAGRDLAVLMKRGDVHAMSFGFSVPNRGDSWSDDGMTRQLKEIRLHEVSIVTGFPAYEATTASVRSLDILATRTNVDVDALADALTKLESGEKLPNIQADLLQEVVTKLRENTPSSDELLEIKRKQLDLLLKVV
jgi:HK97 family phage prohead protease